MTSPLEQTVLLLKEILAARLADIVRYTNYSLMASGRERLTYFDAFAEQTRCSLHRAQEIGQILVAMNERPNLSPDIALEPSRQSVREMLLRSLNQERRLLHIHRTLLKTVKDGKIGLDDFVLAQISASEASCQQFSQLLSRVELSTSISTAEAMICEHAVVAGVAV